MRKFASLALAPFLLLASVGAGRADEASDRQAFHDFLVQAKNNASADTGKGERPSTRPAGRIGARTGWIIRTIPKITPM